MRPATNRIGIGYDKVTTCARTTACSNAEKYRGESETRWKPCVACRNLVGDISAPKIVSMRNTNVYGKVMMGIHMATKGTRTAIGNYKVVLRIPDIDTSSGHERCRHRTREFWTQLAYHVCFRHVPRRVPDTIEPWPCMVSAYKNGLQTKSYSQSWLNHRTVRSSPGCHRRGPAEARGGRPRNLKSCHQRNSPRKTQRLQEPAAQRLRVNAMKNQSHRHGREHGQGEKEAGPARRTSQNANGRGR